MSKKILALLFCLLTITPIYAGSEWIAEPEKDGIKIFTRTPEGSNIKEFKGEVIVNYNYRKVNSVIDNIANLENWMADSGTNFLVDTYNIQPNGSKELYLFNITTTPFGVSYRCGLLYSRVTITDQKITRTMELAQDSQLNAKNLKKLNDFFATLPLTKNGTVLKKSKLSEMVRFTEMYGVWIFEKINENQTKIIYTVKTNPGGYVPVALANETTKSNPYKTLKGMLKQLNK